MNYKNKVSSHLSESGESSFIISDSEEENENFFKKSSTCANTRIIEDTDSESENSNNVHEKKKIYYTSDIEPSNSDEDDIKFMNKSHRVSIINHSSDSESDEIKSRKFNKFKRQSIFENSHTRYESSPTFRPIFRKSKKPAVLLLTSDSDSSVDFKRECIGQNSSSQINELKNKQEKISSVTLNSKTSLSKYQELNSEYDNKKREVTELKQKKSDENYSSTDSFVTCDDVDNKSEILSESSFTSRTQNINKERISFVKGTPVSKDNEVISIDSSEDCSVNETSQNQKFSKKQNETEEIIISSSSNTSENEIDKDVLETAKKEIGVGNIDPIQAQKREQLQLQIIFIENKLEKVEKFANSIDVTLLPDNGLKVYQMIKQHQEELLMLKYKLAKLTRKSEKLKISKDKIEHSPNMNLQKSDRSFIKKKNTHVDINKNVSNDNLNKKVNTNNSKDFHEFDNFENPSERSNSFDVPKLNEKALIKYNKEMTLADQRLEQLHKSLVGCPAADKKEKDPAGLKISLMPHQQHALAWIKWREKQKPSGGILADDMGLGKTLTMISLILSTVNDDSSSDDDDDDDDDDDYLTNNKYKRYYGNTLVVCPASLIDQWNLEIKSRCKRGLLSTVVFHGNNRNMEDKKLSKFDVVITTYQVLVREAAAETNMYKMEWKRVIIDEAHYIRNHKSKACLGVCGLNAKHKWALTGTPIQNKEMDLYAILKFLKCSPFDNLQSWKRWVDNKTEAGKQRLITIIKTLLLRRTKLELQSMGSLKSLPEKNVEIIEIKMDSDENLVYQKMLLFSQNLFAQFLYQRAEKQQMKEYDSTVCGPSISTLGSQTQFTKAQKLLLDYHRSVIKSHEILTLLLRLRQLCCHPALIHSILDKEDVAMNGLDVVEEINTDLLESWQNMSLHENEVTRENTYNFTIDKKVASNLLTKNNPVFDNNRRSSKVRAVIKRIEQILETGDKLIVVSQWTSFLKVIAEHLVDVDNAKYAMFTGSVAIKHRQTIIDKINDPHDDVNILLLSLTAGGVGLNIVGANHLLLVDIHWNPQLEAQAQDRIYRFGQNKDVYIYKFICKDTIEERVKRLQDSKLGVANHILTGTRLLSSKLTVEDLKLLFS